MATVNPSMDPDRLEWTIQPIKNRPVRGILAGLLCLVIWVIVWFWAQSPIFLVLAIVFLGGSIAPFYLPVRFSLTTQGVERVYLGFSVFKPWSYFRSFYQDRSGILLSPFPKRSFLESYRGFYLRFEKDSEAILEYVRAKMEQN